MGAKTIAESVAIVVFKSTLLSAGRRVGRAMHYWGRILIDNNDFELMWLTLHPLHPVPPRLLSVVSWWQLASVLRELRCSLVNEVARCPRSRTLAFFRSQIEMHAVLNWCQQSLRKIPLSTYSSYNLSHLIALIHSTSTYSVGDLFESWLKCIIPLFVFAILFSVATVSSKYLTASQYDVTVPTLWRLCNFNFKALLALSTTTAGHFMKACHSRSGAPSSTQFVSHVSLKAVRKVKIEIWSNDSNIWDAICTCRRLANLFTFQAILS